MPLNWNKPLQTRDGKSVRVIARNLKIRNYDECARAVLASWGDGTETLYSVFEDGGACSPLSSEWDVINAPQSFTRWLNVYSASWNCGVHSSLHIANDTAKRSGDRIALYRLQFSESGILEQSERLE